ncbi:MAG: Gfo/Idh/MocA family oxidoreductase [Planctomycetes bacterium]|nr:Gfo/Idh/MocA family oxidoreductase [Planctomycetota bacterium]
MTTLAQLHQAVRKALDSKRLGKVVFVRYHLQGLLDAEGAALPALAKVVPVVGEWVGQTPQKPYHLAPTKEGRPQEVIVMQFPGGATALLSEAHGKAAPGVSLMVLGNRGALYHTYDAGRLHTWESTPGPKSLKPAQLKGNYGVLVVTGSHTHQENYAAAFAADKRCRIVAVSDEKDIDRRRRRLNERLARELGVPYEPDLLVALQRKDVDIVSICAEPERRGRIIVRCAEAGKHLYLDKSLAPRLDEAEAIVAAVRKAKVRSHMFTLVTTPWAAQAKKVLESGKLGKLLALHADVLFAKGRPGTAKLGTPRKEEYPPKRHQLIEAKRELDNVGVYPITLAAWLTGRKFRTVYGVTANYFFREHQQADVEDFGLLACTLDDGTPVTIAAGRCGWTSHPAGGVNQLLMVGSERSVLIDANAPRLETYTDETPWTPPNMNPEDPMGFWTSTQAAVHLRPKQTWLPFGPAAQSDASYFLDRLDTGKDSELSVIEAAHATEVLLAGYLSASKGEAVKLPLPR